MIYDGISNLIANINHGYSKNKLYINVIPNKLVFKLLNVLYGIGYIRGFVLQIETGRIRVFLKYFNNKRVVNLIKRISTPGRKIYWSYSKLHYMCGKTRCSYILSTSRGLLTSSEAVSSGIGGEILFMIY